jgi:hypothetical protein
MSQFFTIMLIGRQAFLILMATEAKPLQSVSHDILPPAKSPLLEKSAFLRNLCLPSLVWQAPRPKVYCKVDRAGQVDVVAVKSFS